MATEQAAAVVDAATAQAATAKDEVSAQANAEINEAIAQVATAAVNAATKQLNDAKEAPPVRLGQMSAAEYPGPRRQDRILPELQCRGDFSELAPHVIRRWQPSEIAPDDGYIMPRSARAVLYDATHGTHVRGGPGDINLEGIHSTSKANKTKRTTRTMALTILSSTPKRTRAIGSSGKMLRVSVIGSERAVVTSDIDVAAAGGGWSALCRLLSRTKLTALGRTTGAPSVVKAAQQGVNGSDEAQISLAEFSEPLPRARS